MTQLSALVRATPRARARASRGRHARPPLTAQTDCHARTAIAATGLVRRLAKPAPWAPRRAPAQRLGRTPHRARAARLAWPQMPRVPVGATETAQLVPTLRPLRPAEQLPARERSISQLDLATPALARYRQSRTAQPTKPAREMPAPVRRRIRRAAPHASTPTPTGPIAASVARAAVRVVPARAGNASPSP